MPTRSRKSTSKPPNPTLLVGTGPMAVAYAHVLKAQRRPILVIGRGSTSADVFFTATGIRPVTGGLQAWLHTKPDLPQRAIVAVSENELGKSTLALLRAGVRSILVEKPGGFTPNQIQIVAQQSKRRQAKVFVGYNRRFYASVLAAEKIIKRDGGISSFSFEFTEWAHVIGPLKKAPGIKERWFLHNSTHVIDLAFFLGGLPKQWSAYRGGKLPWHPSGAIFVGAGRSTSGALFSYQANWTAPGRWGVEILTKKHRLIFRPMEKLQIQNLGSVKIVEVPIDDRLDITFKSGLYRQVSGYFKQDKRLCTIDQQKHHLKYYSQF